MRRVAQALDTGPASLYVYVADRDELHDLLFDAAPRPSRPSRPTRRAGASSSRTSGGGWSR